ncbi:MAG: hypothetical protein B7Z29_01315 [Hyphomicrobium sp. 12-62-95]|nr:MAG: hypothetical protein B7Z29_01315 [Hyphomicrobium sp. 12-62-95]
MLVALTEFGRRFTGLVQNGNRAEGAVLDQFAGLDEDDRRPVVVIVRGNNPILGNRQPAHAKLEVPQIAPAGQVDFMEDGAVDANVWRILDLPGRL